MCLYQHSHIIAMERLKRYDSRAFLVDRRVGFAVFQLGFARRRWELLGERHLRVLGKEEEWIIHNYREDRWREIFAAMTVSSVQRLWIGMAAVPTIIKDISSVAFLGLIQLHLSHNQIASLQPLTRMRLPHLFILDISRNHIVSLKAMKYANMPVLGGLYISGNPIRSLTVLAQCSLRYLDILQLEWPSSPVLDESLEWLARVDSKRIRMTRCESEERIGQKEIVGRVLGRRHKGMRIKVFSGG